MTNYNHNLNISTLNFFLLNTSIRNDPVIRNKQLICHKLKTKFNNSCFLKTIYDRFILYGSVRIFSKWKEIWEVLKKSSFNEFFRIWNRRNFCERLGEYLPISKMLLNNISHTVYVYYFFGTYTAHFHYHT